MDKSGTPYVPVSDQPGTTWNLLDASAAKANSYTYDAYGVARGTSDTVPNKYRFGTKPLDADPAVYHFIARVYCPALGRFIRPDSLGEPSQPSMGLESATMGGDGLYFSSAATRLPSGGRPLPQYVFVSSAPLTHTDPWGLLDYTDILHTGNILVMKEWPGYLYEAVGVRTDKGRYVAAGGRLLGTSHPPNPAYTDPTYWCHGYTFDGVNQLGGPFSLIGPSVLTVLQDDAWRLIRCSCAIPGHDIVVFYHYENEVVHSGKVTHVVVTEGKFDELHSWIRSKHELAALGPSTFIQEVERYNASYSCYASRKNAPLRLPTGPGWGDHERSWSGSGDYYGVPM
jgi:RHS repeat-associated protein